MTAEERAKACVQGEPVDIGKLFRGPPPWWNKVPAGIEARIAAAIREAEQAMKERCAKVAEEKFHYSIKAAEQIAAAIRELE